MTSFWPFFLNASRVPFTLSLSKLVPLLPPRKITKPCSFPLVLVMAASPCLVTPMKWCFEAADPTASIATERDPSVPFLNPTGKERPLANSLCSWLSVVLAPIAPKEIRSARNCGDMVSSISLAIGIPRPVRSQNSCLETLKPLLILNVSFISGSLIKPFQPTVVLGFSR